MTDHKEYYKILEVSTDASPDTIKLAYRDLAKKYHPDVHSDKEESVKKGFEETFKKLNEAYEVLSDSNKRAIYDSGGNTKGQHSNPHADMEAFIRQHFGGMNFNFGGIHGFNNFNQQLMSVDKEISYHQMICGGEIEIDNTPVGKIKVNLPAGAFPGASFRVSIRKDASSEILLQITLKLKIPNNLTQEQKDKIKELQI